MVNNLGKHRILWLVTAGLTALAAIIGLKDVGIYRAVVNPELMPGVYGQDLISLVASALLAVLAAITKNNHPKKQIVALGILGYLFYAYGIYVIEQVYNVYYLVYMAIWTLSFWGIAYGVGSIRKDVTGRFASSNPVRRFSIAVALLQPLVFYPLWIAALVPLMQQGNRIENLFSVYILDLCLIMPAFLILAWLLVKKKAMGFALTPALFILGFVIIFSLAVSELAKPMFGQAIITANVLQAGGLSALFLAAVIIHLYALKTGN